MEEEIEYIWVVLRKSDEKSRTVHVPKSCMGWVAWCKFYSDNVEYPYSSLQALLAMRENYMKYTRTIANSIPHRDLLRKDCPTQSQLRYGWEAGVYDRANGLAELLSGSIDRSDCLDWKTTDYEADAISNVHTNEKGFIPMNASILKVKYNDSVTAKKYSFLGPKDYDIKELPFAVVVKAGVGDVTADNFGPDGLVLVRVVEKIDIIDDNYDGTLKWIVAGFSLEKYKSRIERARRQERLLRIVKARVERKNTLETYLKLAEGDEEALAMLKEIEELSKDE